MESNTGKAPSASSPRAPVHKQTTPAKRSAATKETPPAKKVKQTHPAPRPSSSIDANPQGPVFPPLAASAAPVSAPASPTMLTQRDESQQVEGDLPVVEKLEQSLNIEKGLGGGLPEDEREVGGEGKGKGKTPVHRPEDSWAGDMEMGEKLLKEELLLKQLADVEVSRQVRKKELRDRFKLDEYDAELSMIKECFAIQRKKLQERLDKLLLGV